MITEKKNARIAGTIREKENRGFSVRIIAINFGLRKSYKKKST
jgi:hypothetical protein